VNAGAPRALPPRLACVLQRRSQVHCTVRAWDDETGGANGSGPERASGPPVPPVGEVRTLADVTSGTLRRWRQSQGWDVPRMARELRKAARDSGEDVAAHHGLVKMIPQWERGNRAPGSGTGCCT
jgi:hypothetical protein